MQTVNSLKSLHSVFGFDFYGELDYVVEHQCRHVLMDTCFLHKYSDKAKENEEAYNELIHSKRRQIELFDLYRKVKEEITTDEEFEKSTLTDLFGSKFYLIDMAVPLETAKDWNPDEGKTSVDKGIYAFVQLMDENHKPLLGSDIEIPSEKCTSINDERVLLLLMPFQKHDGKTIISDEINSYGNTQGEWYKTLG